MKCSANGLPPDCSGLPDRVPKAAYLTADSNTRLNVFAGFGFNPSNTASLKPVVVGTDVAQPDATSNTARKNLFIFCLSSALVATPKTLPEKS